MSLLLVAGIAGATQVQIEGLAAESVVVVLENDDSLEATRCDPAGPDRWRCEPPDLDLAVDLALVVNGTLHWLDRFEPLPPRVNIARTDSGWQLQEARTAPLPPATAVGAGALLARISGHTPEQAPMLLLTGPQGTWQMACRDDGSFPDTTHNDGQYGCGGPLHAPAATRFAVSLRGRSGAQALGEVQWENEEALYPLHISTEQPPSPDPLPLSIRPDPVASGTTPTPTATTPGGPPPAAEGRTPEATWVVLVLGGGLLVGLLFRRRPRALPEHLRSLPPAPLFEGGPTPMGRPALIQTADPQTTTTRLLHHLVGQRRVALLGVAPEHIPSGHPVYHLTSADRQDIETALSELARLPGAPVVLLITDPAAVVDPGSLHEHPVEGLLDGLPAGVWSAVIAPLASPPLEQADTWIVEDGQWRAG